MSATAEEQEELPGVEVTWTCIGARYWHLKGKQEPQMMQVWIDEEGKERGYKLPKGLIKVASAGSQYRLRVEIEDDSVTVYPTLARYVGQHEDRALVQRWWAQTRMAESELAHKRAQAKAKEDDTFRAMLMPLRAFIWRNRAAIDRYQLAQAIVAELLRPLTKAEEDEVKAWRP